jgi:hypothetical protein
MPKKVRARVGGLWLKELVRAKREKYMRERKLAVIFSRINNAVWFKCSGEKFFYKKSIY